MKAIYKNIAMAALALGAVACSQEDDFSPSYLNDPDAVRITAQVGTDDVTGGFTRSNPIGGDEEQKGFNANDQIAVATGSQAAVTYTYDGSGTWNPETDKYLKWESEGMTFFTAWYPVSDGTDAANFTPNYGEAASLKELAANDYMTYSGAPEKGSGNSVSLTMQRQMVRIVVDFITYNTQYDAIANAVTSIAITAGSGKYESDKWKGDNVTAQMYQHTDGYWYAVLPPTAEAEADATFLTITLKDVAAPLVVKGIPATVAGNSYSFSLAVGKNMASIKELLVNDWTTEGVIDATKDKVDEQMLYTYENGTYNVYRVEGLEAAIEAAGTTASTIKLMSALTITDGIRFEANTDITIDLNGSNFTVSTSPSDTVLYNCGKLNIDNCVINNDQGSGIRSTSNSELTIGENVKVSAAEIAVGMYGNNSIINGGEIKGKYALWCASGDVTIKGGTFTATNDGYVVCGNGANSVSISGGSFTGKIWESESTNLTITGGTFSVDPSAYVPKGYTATSTTDESGTYWTVSATTDK